MEKISFGSKDYVKAAVVAKRFRYTQDYVGQLCRSNKVDARLVGRTWYVDADSVSAYRKTKHQTQKRTSARVQQSKRNPRVTNPIPVTAVVRTKTAKTTTATRIAESTVRSEVVYSKDSGSAIPIMSIKSSPRSKDTAIATSSPAKSPTHTAKPKKIKIIRSKAGSTDFLTDKLPEISLSGKLKVGSIEHDDAVLKKPPSQADVVHHQPLDGGKRNKKPEHQLTSVSDVSDAEVQSGTEAGLVNFTPREVESKSVVDSKESSVRLFIWPVVALLLSLVCAACLLGVGRVYETNSEAMQPTSSLTFGLDFQAVVSLLRAQ